jgi:hypothetical protein
VRLSEERRIDALRDENRERRPDGAEQGHGDSVRPCLRTNLNANQKNGRPPT